MRAVVQRVARASVTVDGLVVGAIERGLLVLLGVAAQDPPGCEALLARKLALLRVFPDEQGKMNRSVEDTNGEVLVVSQFTLFGDARSGRRPSYASAAPAELGRALYADLVRELRERGVRVETGTFQAHMIVELTNDGPVTILIDSKKQF